MLQVLLSDSRFRVIDLIKLRSFGRNCIAKGQLGVLAPCMSCETCFIGVTCRIVQRKMSTPAKTSSSSLFLVSYVVACAMNLLKLDTFDSVRESCSSPSDSLVWVSKAIIDKFFGEGEVSLLAADDFVQQYASKTLTLGLLYS